MWSTWRWLERRAAWIGVLAVSGVCLLFSLGLQYPPDSLHFLSVALEQHKLGRHGEGLRQHRRAAGAAPPGPGAAARARPPRRGRPRAAADEGLLA